jgi:acetylglutamate kinase
MQNIKIELNIAQELDILEKGKAIQIKNQDDIIACCRKLKNNNVAYSLVGSVKQINKLNKLL